VPIVIFLNGLVLLFFAALMALDALIFPGTGGVFLLSALLTGLTGALLALASGPGNRRPHRLDGFVLTSSVWIVAAVAGALPLWLWQLSPVDAFFEAMSGITTTGSTVMVGLDTTQQGILFWRALLQGLGGVGFIVTGMALLPALRVGGMQLYRTESSDKGEKELRNAASFALATLGVYLGLIAICAALYALGGMGPFDAITHAMTTLSTGGYSNYDASFGHFANPFLHWVATVFMLAGALPFAWYIRILLRHSLRSEQVEAMLKTLIPVVLGFTLWLWIMRDIAFWEALRLVAFNMVSVISTTGYASADYTLWGPFSVVVFFGLTAVGGCTGSTAGGAKAMRWLMMGRAMREQIARLSAPHRVTVVRYEGRRVEPDVLNGIIAFFVIYFATFMGLAVVLSLMGLDFTTATTGSLTALANVGPGAGALIGPAGNFATLSDGVKTVLALGMYLGRLEMLTVLVLLMPAFWREALD
jgi:trk system potassium uptake protein TrkH